MRDCLTGTRALTTATGIQVHPVGTDTKLDALFLAGNLLRTGTSFTEPDTIILNPADYGDVRLVKDSEGRYLTGDPAAAGPPTIFGTRVLVSNKIAASTVGTVRSERGVTPRDLDSFTA